jgi:hypothetical protein
MIYIYTEINGKNLRGTFPFAKYENALEYAEKRFEALHGNLKCADTFVRNGESLRAEVVRENTRLYITPSEMF